MKREPSRMPDGRYLLYYSFDAAELRPPGKRGKSRRAARAHRARKKVR
jgi:hypothetical protein